MEMIGKRVKHVKFGEGKIVNQYDNKMEVDFGNFVKRFLYPDSFLCFFTIYDKKAEKYINKKLEELNEIKRENALKREAKVYRETLKIKLNSHAVFDIKEEELLRISEEWKISTGCNRQGKNKEKIKIPKNLNMNSACILTAKGIGKRESERRIVGLFMAEEDFVGAQCETGIIAAHEQYRIICDSEEIYFWDYFPEEKRLKNWGSMKMKYTSAVIVRAILHNILTNAADENYKHELEEFDEYFCEVNHI